MISVVLPVYNGEKYLEQAINSILNQTYKNIELVIVNDCSTDKSLEIISDFQKKDARIKVINNRINQRLPKSLNIGFSECKGDYYTWTSDDNILFPDALEKLYNELQKSGADLIFSRCETIDSEGRKLGETDNYNNLNEIYYNNIVLACFLYKREIHDTLNGYDVTKFLVEDYDFWLRAYRQFNFIFTAEILYKIRFHENNLGVKNMEDVKLRKISLLKENLDYIKDGTIIDGIHKEISNCYFEIANIYYKKIVCKSHKKEINLLRVKDIFKKIIGL